MNRLQLQQDYEQGIQLRKRWEQCHMELASMATVAVASPRRQGRSNSGDNLKKQRRGKIILWGTAGAFLLLAILALYSEHGIMGAVSLGLAVLFSGAAYLLYRGKESGDSANCLIVFTERSR